MYLVKYCNSEGTIKYKEFKTLDDANKEIIIWKRRNDHEHQNIRLYELKKILV